MSASSLVQGVLVTLGMKDCTLAMMSSKNMLLVRLMSGMSRPLDICPFSSTYIDCVRSLSYVTVVSTDLLRVVADELLSR
eukprot:5621939-Amphidinium_carterae.2